MAAPKILAGKNRLLLIAAIAAVALIAILMILASPRQSISPPVPPSGACGDNSCSAPETCSSCSLDCGACAKPRCGDSSCGAGEDCSSCPSDCGSCQPCAEQNEIPSPGRSCCQGLTAINATRCENGACVLTGGPAVCTNCGDWVCTQDYGENRCSCPQDCGGCGGKLDWKLWRSVKNESECDTYGGRWRIWSFDQGNTSKCDMPLPDAGAPCTGFSQCAGSQENSCIYLGVNPVEGIKATGQCRGWVSDSCVNHHYFVEDGKVVKVECVE